MAQLGSCAGQSSFGNSRPLHTKPWQLAASPSTHLPRQTAGSNAPRNASRNSMADAGRFMTACWKMRPPVGGLKPGGTGGCTEPAAGSAAAVAESTTASATSAEGCASAQPCSRRTKRRPSMLNTCTCARTQGQAGDAGNRHMRKVTPMRCSCCTSNVQTQSLCTVCRRLASALSSMHIQGWPRSFATQPRAACPSLLAKQAGTTVPRAPRKQVPCLVNLGPIRW